MVDVGELNHWPNPSQISHPTYRRRRRENPHNQPKITAKDRQWTGMRQRRGNLEKKTEISGSTRAREGLLGQSSVTDLAT